MTASRILSGIFLAALIASPAHAITDAQKSAAYKAAGLTGNAGALQNECKRPVTPQFEAIALGGSVGEAVTMQIEDSICYGNAGSRMLVLKPEGDRVRVLFDNSSVGAIIPLKTTHKGVADIKIGVPGMQIPVWKWNGKKYVFWKSVRDGN